MMKQATKTTYQSTVQLLYMYCHSSLLYTTDQLRINGLALEACQGWGLILESFRHNC